MARQSGTEWLKSCHMSQRPSAFPAFHSSRAQSGRTLFASSTRALTTLRIGRSLRFQTAMAGKKSKGETSMACRVACAAKHFALVTRQGSPAALPSATMEASSSFRPSASRPVAGSVTSCRNLRRR